MARGACVVVPSMLWMCGHGHVMLCNDPSEVLEKKHRMTSQPAQIFHDFSNVSFFDLFCMTSYDIVLAS